MQQKGKNLIKSRMYFCNTTVQKCNKKNILTMYLVCAINADTMAGRQETIEQFLARGGKIKIIPSCGKF